MSKWNVKHKNSCTKTWLSVFYFYNGQVMKWFSTGLQAQHMNLDHVSLKKTQHKYLLQWPTVAHEVLVFDSIFTSSTNMTIIFWLKDPAQFRFLAILIIHYFSVTKCRLQITSYFLCRPDCKMTATSINVNGVYIK